MGGYSAGAIRVFLAPNAPTMPRRSKVPAVSAWFGPAKPPCMRFPTPPVRCVTGRVSDYSKGPVVPKCVPI